MKVLVRSTNWLGDAVMNTAALMALKERDPAGEIAVLAIPRVADIFHHHPAVDRILVYDRKGKDRGLRGTVRLAGRVRREGFDRAYVFPNSFHSALIPFLAGVPERTGYALNGRRPLLTQAIPIPSAVKAEHQTRYYLHLVGGPGGSYEPLVVVSDEERAAAAGRLQDRGFGPEKLLVGISPGAAYGPAKRWFPDRFAAVADRMMENRDCQTIVFGSAGEAEIASSVAENVRGTVWNAAGQTSLRELAALVSCCSVFLTNDSGPMHLAAALGIPVVAVFGSTDPIATGPFGSGHVIIHHPLECSPCLKRTCPPGHYQCMKDTTVSEVCRAVEGVLEQRSGE